MQTPTPSKKDRKSAAELPNDLIQGKAQQAKPHQRVILPGILFSAGAVTRRVCTQRLSSIRGIGVFGQSIRRTTAPAVTIMQIVL
jgi:hypothetical protein